jgi:hypothetical protein
MPIPIRSSILRDEGWRRLVGLLPGILTLAVLLPIYGLTQAPGLTWANYGMDGGDLFAAAATLGVPHPTGYPTYVLLARGLLAIPLGDPARRLIWLSSLGIALAAGLMATLAARASGKGGFAGALRGTAVGLAFGLAPIPWSQALVIEVHGLQALFVASALALWAGWEGAEVRRAGPLVALGGLCGLALGNHITFGLLLPALAFAYWRTAAMEVRGRWAVGPILAFGLGLGVYAYLPLAARGHPPINWGDPSTWAGFRWVVTGGPYRGLAFGLPLAEIPRRIAAWADLLVGQFGLLGVAAGLVGLVYGRSRLPWLDRISYWMVPVFSLFALGYNTADSFDYLIPAYLGFAWWIALGLRAVAEQLARFGPRRAALLASALLLAEVGLRVPARWRGVDASGDQAAQEFVARILAEAPPQALVITEGTEDSFALWYARYGRGWRPDLRVVVAPLAQYEWYREGLRHTYPALAFPDSYSGDPRGWVDRLLGRNPGPVCRTHLNEARSEARVSFRCDL